jgi:hypothetical protein
MFFRPYLSLKAPKTGAAKNVQAANTDMSALMPTTTCCGGRYLPTIKGRRGSTTENLSPTSFSHSIYLKESAKLPAISGIK